VLARQLLEARRSLGLLRQKCLRERPHLLDGLVLNWSDLERSRLTDRASLGNIPVSTACFEYEALDQRQVQRAGVLVTLLAQCSKQRHYALPAPELVDARNKNAVRQCPVRPRHPARHGSTILVETRDDVRHALVGTATPGFVLVTAKRSEAARFRNNALAGVDVVLEKGRILRRVDLLKGPQ
jgi:hypothetical protein